MHVVCNSFLNFLSKQLWRKKYSYISSKDLMTMSKESKHCFRIGKIFYYYYIYLSYLCAHFVCYHGILFFIIMVICLYQYVIICNVKLEIRKITKTRALHELVCGDPQKTILNNVTQISVNVPVQTFKSFNLRVF